MDWTTVVGILLGAGVVVYGVIESKSLDAFLNWHGFFLVTGGTFAAVLINTPAGLFWQAVKACRFLFRKSRGITSSQAVGILVGLAEKARRLGNVSIENDGQGVGDGFLQAAIDTCLAGADEKLAKEVLGQRLRQERLRHTEVTNIFRTMSVLFPMFGLVGTLIGIVTVLKNISNPKSVGPAMGMALSTAFFGILFANLACIPVAGKLRLRALEEEIVKEIMAEGILKIFFTGQVPSQIGLYLESYLARRQAQAVAKAGAGAAVPAAQAGPKPPGV